MRSTICYFFGHAYRENPKGHTWKFSCKNCDVVTDHSDRERWYGTFWASDTWDYLKIILLAIFIMLFAFLCLGIVFSATSYASCQSYSEMGIKTVWDFWTGCMAEHPKFGWIPVEKYFEVINLYIP